jgi:hypothetical protein
MSFAWARRSPSRQTKSSPSTRFDDRLRSYENFSGDWAVATFSPDGRSIALGCPYDFDVVVLEWDVACLNDGQVASRTAS